ncbi:MAG: DNA polymerase subunit beta [Methanobacteriaceae archaeon]|nr:DNA polymerase subunit beta [Methanobacteriaceae archaeon]
MRARTRDFIYTTDDLFFATTSYLHPEDRILAFLRYIPDPEGERIKNGKTYTKVGSKEAYSFLKENYPYYLYDCNNTNVQMMGVPLNKIKEILRPNERLKEIRDHYINIGMKDDKFNENHLLKKVIKVADTFHEGADIPYENMGISGSILPELYDSQSSDIDFVIYGMANHHRAMNLFGKIKDTTENKSFKSIDDNYWRKVYDKRISDSTLSFKEFCWYEKRKSNRGVVDGTLFDILATREWEEISGTWGDTRYEPMGQMTVECTVSNALASFDNPAVYKVHDVKIIEIRFDSLDNNPIDINISEIASFTHTYSGQALEGERIMARGKLEKVIGKKESYRIVVGTTRESLNEFIKLKDNPLTSNP